jgi:ABC-type ATPase with predicted acetyltransferase domain
VRIGIRTNEPEALNRVSEHFPPLWKPSPISAVERLFSLRVGKTTHALFEEQERVAKSRSLKSVLETFEARLKIYVAEMARRRVFIHAGAVGWQGRAIIIPGRSYSGKTSLVAELVRAGATYYSDEYAVLDLQGRLHPYPQPLAMRKPGSFGQKKCLVEEIGGHVGIRPLPVGLVVVSQYKPGVRWRPATLSAGQAVLELLAHTVPARRKPEMVIPALQRAVWEATLLKGARGEAEETARLMLQ